MAAPPPVSALGVLVRDESTSTDLYELSPDTVDANKSPASLVKLATAYIAYNLKSGVLDSETITVTSGDLALAASGLGLLANDVVTWREALEMLLHASDNAIAETIARVIGDELGSPGGRTRFITEMGTLATTLSLSNTTFVSPNGFPATTDRSTARDMADLAVAVWNLDSKAVRGFSNKATYTFTVTGPSARSIGPIANPVDVVDDDGTLATKGGFQDLSGSANDTWSVLSIWQVPAGQEVIMVNLHSTEDGDRYLDHRAMRYEAVEEFSALVTGVGVGVDEFVYDVMLLAGFDGSIVDEGPLVRTLTANGSAAVNATDPMMGTGDLDPGGAVGDYVSTPDTDNLSMDSEDFTLELYLRGDGAEPGAFEVMVSKWVTAGNNREWTLSYDPASNRFAIQYSTTGADFPSAAFDLDSFDMTPAVFFNGAKRHILGRRNGTEFAVYVNGDKDTGNTSTASVALFTGTADAAIGALTGGAVNNYNGNLDEVRITRSRDRTAGAVKFTPTGRKFPRPAGVSDNAVAVPAPLASRPPWFQQ